MSLVKDMTGFIRNDIEHDITKCSHLRSGIDSYTFPLSILEEVQHYRMCRTCYEGTPPTCDRCRTISSREWTYCILTVVHFGASAWEDHFVAVLCDGCGQHIPLGIRQSFSELVRVNDKENILILIGRADRSSTGTPPPMSFTEKQGAKLARAWKKAEEKAAKAAVAI